MAEVVFSPVLICHDIRLFGKPHSKCTLIYKIINVKNLIKYGKSFKDQSTNSDKVDPEAMEEVDRLKQVW